MNAARQKDGEHPVVTLTHFLLGTTPGLITSAVLGVALLCTFSPGVRKVVGPVWRLATGGLVFREMSPWHSTWLRPAPERPEARPNFRGESYPLTGWGRMAGWQRMVIRWTVTAYLVALLVWGWVTIAATVLVGLVLAGRRLGRELAQWAHRHTVGVFALGAAKVLRREDDPLTWIAIPRLRIRWHLIVVSPRIIEWVSWWPRARRGVEWLLRHMRWVDRLAIPTLCVPLADDHATVLVSLDAQVTGLVEVTEVKRMGLSRIPDGPWEAAWKESELVVEFTHPKRPPSHVTYDEDAFNAFPVDEIPIGKNSAGQWATLPLKRLTPHTVMSATTGWCKTSTANCYIAHAAGNGGRVAISDPKRVGYQHFTGLENVTIRVTADGWAATQAEFLAEMERRYALIERFPEMKENPELYFQPWFLVIDERGSYVSDLTDRAKEQGEKGVPLPLRQEKKLLWQGRAAGMYVLDLCQQAGLKVFVDSDGRDQRMARIASGPQSRSSWMMLFPGMAKLRVGMKKGRAVLGIGVDSVEEIQLAQISDTEARAYAELGASVAARENELREKRIAALVSSSVPSLTQGASPADTSASVHPDRNDTRTSPESGENLTTGPRINFPVQRNNSVENAPEMPAMDAAVDAPDTVSPAGDVPELVIDLREPAPADQSDLVVGIRAAAVFLDMNEEAFAKARRRRPIRGESRLGVQPCWTQLALREWRAAAPRAGGPRG